MLYIILSILFIILILILINREKFSEEIEGYDERYVGLDIWKCGDFCKKTAGCYGFAYNPSLGICYPSKRTLIGKPTDPSVLFRSSYSPNNTVCNKMQPIDTPLENPPFDLRRSNSIYLCKQGAHYQPQYYLHNKKGWRDIGEGKMLDEVFEIDNYNVREYNWPINKFNNDQQDLLVDYLVSRFPNQYNVSNIYLTSDYANRNIFLYENQPHNRYRSNINNTIDNSWRYVETFDNVEPFDLDLRLNTNHHPKSDPMQDVALDFGLDQIYNFRSNLVRDSINYFNRLNTTAVKIPIPKPIIHTKPTTFTPYDDYNDGDYLNQYKCVDNITLTNCMDYCLKNDQCVGIEYNPVFGTRTNVCCPKRTIGQFHPRKWIHRHGRFYAKT